MAQTDIADLPEAPPLSIRCGDLHAALLRLLARFRLGYERLGETRCAAPAPAPAPAAAR